MAADETDGAKPIQRVSSEKGGCEVLSVILLTQAHVRLPFKHPMGECFKGGDLMGEIRNCISFREDPVSPPMGMHAGLWSYGHLPCYLSVLTPQLLIQ